MRVNGARICNCREKHKHAVSVRNTSFYRGIPDKATYVLWRCKRCRQVAGQVISGTFSLEQVAGDRIVTNPPELPDPVPPEPAIDPEAESGRFLPEASNYLPPAGDELPVPRARFSIEDTGESGIAIPAEPAELPEPGIPARYSTEEMAFLGVRRGRHHAG